MRTWKFATEAGSIEVTVNGAVTRDEIDDVASEFGLVVRQLHRDADRAEEQTRADRREPALVDG